MVDDEPLARRRLELVLGTLDNVDLVGAAGSVAEARRLVTSLAPDVLLLDIELDGETGFDLLGRLPQAGRPAIIFVTAYSHHATTAFDREAADYVLKPVEPERLAEALRRVRRRRELDQAEVRIDALRSVVDALKAGRTPPTGHETEFWIRPRSGELVRVPVEAITAASSEDDYVRLFAEGRSWLMRETLAGLERRLPPGLFVRVHRAHIARLSSISEIRRGATGVEVRMRDGATLPAGRVHLRALRSRLIHIPSPPPDE